MSGLIGLYIDDEISTFKSKIIFKKCFTIQKVFIFFCFLSNNKDLSKYNQIRNLQRLWTDSVLVLCIAFDYFFIINVGLIDKFVFT